VQTTSLQNCMMSNKDYYKPVLEDGDMFVESKEKFDTATTSQSPQELENAPDSSEAEKEEPSDSPAGPEGSICFVHLATQEGSTGLCKCVPGMPYGTQTSDAVNISTWRVGVHTLFTSMPYYYVTPRRTPIATTLSPLYIFSPLLCLHWVLAAFHLSH